MNGLELAAFLHMKAPFVGIVMMTGDVDLAPKTHTMKHDSFNLVPKPFFDETLLQAVDGAISVSRGGSEQMLQYLSAAN
jgi:FixJ family two-component response regulator